MAMKVPTPALQGATELGNVTPVPKQSGYFNLSYPTPPMKTFDGDRFAGGVMKQLGAGIMQVGTTLQQHYDANNLLEYEKRWLDFERTVLRDPENGALAQYGSNALGLSAAMDLALEDFRKTNADLLQGMSMSGKRSAEAMLNGWQSGTVNAVTNFERQQRATYTQDQLQFGIGQLRDRSALAPMGPEGDKLFKASVSAITQKAEQLMAFTGKPQEEIDAYVQQQVTAAIVTRAQAIADGAAGAAENPIAALGWLDGQKINMDPGTYVEARAALQTQVEDYTGIMAGEAALQNDAFGQFVDVYTDAANQATAELVAASRAGHANGGSGYAPGSAFAPGQQGQALGISPTIDNGVSEINQRLAQSGVAGKFRVKSGYRSPQDQVRGSINGESNVWNHFPKELAQEYVSRWEQLRNQPGMSEFEAGLQMGREYRWAFEQYGLNKMRAAPGYSFHQKGLAADIEYVGPAAQREQAWEFWRNNAGSVGLYNPPAIAHEWWHWEVMGTRGTQVTDRYVPPPGSAGPTVANAANEQVGSRVYQSNLTAANVVIVGGNRATEGEMWHPWGSSDSRAHRQTLDDGTVVNTHADYSQHYRFVSENPFPGSIGVTIEGKGTLYFAPDYERDEAGNYKMYSVDAAIQRAGDTGGVIPDRQFLESFWGQATRLPMQTQAPPTADNPGDAEAFTRFYDDPNEGVAGGLNPGQPRYFAKEFGIEGEYQFGAQGGNAAPTGSLDFTSSMPDWMSKKMGGKAPPQQYVDIAVAAANKHGIPPMLFIALVTQESVWNPTLTSSAGAQGLAQFMPGTAPKWGVTDRTDPRQSLEGGAAFLASLYKEFGSWDLALAGYNAGPGAVRKYGGVPPYDETQGYVKTIMSNWGNDNTPYEGNQHAGTVAGTYGNALPQGLATILNMPVNSPADARIRSKALQYYDQNMKLVDAAEGRAQADFMDQAYTRITLAGEGSDFNEIFTQAEIGQMGDRVAQAIEFQKKVSAGQPPEDNWTLYADQVAMSQEPKTQQEFIDQFFENPDKMLELRESMSDEQFTNLFNTARALNEAQIEAEQEKAAGVEREPDQERAVIPLKTIVGEVETRAEGMGFDLTDTETKQKVSQMAVMAQRQLEQISAEEGVSMDKNAALLKVLDQLEQDIQIGDQKADIYEMLHPGSPLYVDNYYDSSLELLQEMQGMEIGGAPVSEEFSLAVYNGLVMELNGRAPKPHEFLERLFYTHEHTNLRAGSYGGSSFIPDADRINPIYDVTERRFYGEGARPGFEAEGGLLTQGQAFPEAKPWLPVRIMQGIGRAATSSRGIPGARQ